MRKSTMESLCKAAEVELFGVSPIRDFRVEPDRHCCAIKLIGPFPRIAAIAAAAIHYGYVNDRRINATACSL